MPWGNLSSCEKIAVQHIKIRNHVGDFCHKFWIFSSYNRILLCINEIPKRSYARRWRATNISCVSLVAVKFAEKIFVNKEDGYLSHLKVLMTLSAVDGVEEIPPYPC